MSSRKPLPTLLYNERIKLYDPENNITRHVRVDDDGDVWVEDPDGDTSIWFPKRLHAQLITALTRAKGF